MWSHYANNHKGFCIGLNRIKLEKLGLLGVAGGVSYTDYYPKIDPTDTNILNYIFTKTHAKASDWSYEMEYRLTQLWPYHTPSKEERTIRVSDDVIEEIILGLAISDNDRSEIMEEARKKGIPIFKIRKKRSAFLLDKVKL